ncbi:MAG: hypothetical protein A3J63_03545 [Candidatus Moranbacteria bacterium RIFCSPHIGHO2_02_FULL_40_12b]|nr:MAG: hypothetical protein A3J63_03545 [Candidatus Moranbacteria bacterium RIFCSPHIGHO2_02_FULL_40_12b]OGI24153.1 MAG: hypothetical protein A3E91_01450 [Candidatus Moranbacteria bacterium RIFCSPHIGHO2_12_FULL_40_10]
MFFFIYHLLKVTIIHIYFSKSSIETPKSFAIFAVTYYSNILPIYNPSFTSILGSIEVNVNFVKLIAEFI